MKNSLQHSKSTSYTNETIKNTRNVVAELDGLVSNARRAQTPSTVDAVRKLLADNSHALSAYELEKYEKILVSLKAGLPNAKPPSFSSNRRRRPPPSTGASAETVLVAEEESTPVYDCEGDVWVVKNHSGLTRSANRAAEPRTLTLVGLRDSTMEFSSVRVRDSMFVRNCVNSTFFIEACNQLRIRNCEDCEFVVKRRVESDPVIEGSTGIVFKVSEHVDVKDFDWIKSGPSPNFVVVDL